jgi:hypothetical protein
MATKKHPRADITVPHVPPDVATIMDALLRTMPPPAADKSTRKKTKPAQRSGRRSKKAR